MPKTDLGDVCGRYVSSRLSKQTDSSLSNDQQSIETFLQNERPTATEQKRPTIFTEKLFFKSYQKPSVEKFHEPHRIIQNNSSDSTARATMPANNDVLLTAFNNNTTNGTNGTNSSHSYRSSYISCSNGNHSSSPPSEAASSSSSSSSTSNSSSSLMMTWELLKERGSGLINLGNTCFINASLQCLANTPPLVQWLLCNTHSPCCRVKLEKQFCLFCEAERLVKLIHSKNSTSSFSSSSVGAADPNNIVRRIKEISTTFKSGRQEDASEFLICLIDKIVDACLRSSQPPERLRPSSGTSYEQLCHSQTIFHDLFGLVLRSRVVCSRCRHTSDTFEVQYTWIIGVRNITDIRQSLQQFVCRESLSGENLYRCIKCKQLVPAIKRYTLHKASKVLLINLKRFEFGKNSQKLSQLVRYPEYLNVTPYMSEESANDQPLNYRLYAVLVHVGSSMHSGHYFSYVRSPNNRWYKADDATMTQCDLNQVLTQHGAYILCYIKETPSSSTTTTNNNSTSNGSATSTNATPTSSKLVYQNGKLNNSEQSSTTNTTLFTPRQVPVQNPSKQMNGQNGNVKSLSTTMTKPAPAETTNGSTNGGGGGPLSTEKRAPIVVRIARPTFSLNKSALTQNKSLAGTNSSFTAASSCKLVNKSHSTPIILSTAKNSNGAISSTPSLSAVQSTSSPLKLIIKTSGPNSMPNGLASICKSYNHFDDDDEEEEDDEHHNHNHSNHTDSSELEQPVTKKQRTGEPHISSSSASTPSSSLPSPPLATSIPNHNDTTAAAPATVVGPIPAPPPPPSNYLNSSQTKLIDEQTAASPASSSTNHKRKKKKKKSSHKHQHHHHKSHHHHRKRSRRNSSRSRSRTRSRSPLSRSPSYFNSSSSSSALLNDDQHRRHRKSKKHHRQKRHSSSSASPSSSESL